MKKNVMRADRIMRFILAAILVVLYIAGILNSTIGMVALLIAVIMVVTALFSFCPLYAILGKCKVCGPTECSVPDDSKKKDSDCGHCGSEDKNKK